MGDVSLAFALSGGGRAMPAVGFGTCCRKAASGPELITSTKEYLAQGGRMIDTAQLYHNHPEIGQAVSESRVPRRDIWITSKINTRPDRDAVTDGPSALASISATLQELNVTYVDLMLIHGAWKQTTSQREAIWQALLEARRRGIVHHIGVSNYDRKQIEQLVAATSIWPEANQIEFHPWSSNRTFELVRWCMSKRVQVIAYRSLGGSACPQRKVYLTGRARCPANRQDSFKGTVRHLARKFNASTAQVLLRWALDQGVAVIPGATSAAHIRDNLHIPKFHLSQEDSQLMQEGWRPGTFELLHNMGRTPAQSKRADTLFSKDTAL